MYNNDFTNYFGANVYQVLEISKAEDFQKAIKYVRKGIEKIAIACNPSKEDLLLELPLKKCSMRRLHPKQTSLFLASATLTYISY